MTNKEAINLLDNLLGTVDDSQGNDYDHAIHMAMDALANIALANTATDTISRQAAIDAINTWPKYGVDERNRVVPWNERFVPYVRLEDVIKAIIGLPSAQPDVSDTNVGNMVSISAVVDMAGKSEWFESSDSYNDFVWAICALPSVQPEIIRKPVMGYEGYYEVDNCGRVYALDRVVHVEDHGRSYDKPLTGGIIKQHMHSKGYKIVSLTRDGESKNVFVHRIVAMAFLPNPDKLPCINHKDEDKTNNFVENLEWCTYQYNNAYGSKPKKHSKRMSGRKLSDEHKQHISEGHKRHWNKIRAERRTDEQT